MPAAPSTPTPPAVQPVGTPPEGGRWTWDAQAAEWLRLPEQDPNPPAASATSE